MLWVCKCHTWTDFLLTSRSTEAPVLPATHWHWDSTVCGHILALVHLLISHLWPFIQKAVVAWHALHGCNAAGCVCSTGCACSGYNSTDVTVVGQNSALMCAQGEWIMHTAPDERLLCVLVQARRKSAMDLRLCSVIHSEVFLWLWGWVLILRGQVQDFQLGEVEEQTGNRGKKVFQNNHSSPPLPVLCRMVHTTCYTTSEHVRVSSSLVLNAPSCPLIQIVILI